MIELLDIRYTVNKQTILDRIDLQVTPGDFWLVIGPNGAGKTTTLKIICGQIHDYLGHARIGGQEIKRIPVKEMAKYLSYQPQFDDFPLPIKIKEILLAGRYPYKSFFKDYSSEDYRIYHHVVQKLELESFVDRDITTLSGGERKKVMIASAFIQDVDIIVFDEPFTFLDPEAISNLKKMMIEMNRMGKTLIVVSHDFEIMYPIVNKILALKKGQVVYAGDKVFDKAMLKQTYNTAFEKIMFGSKEIIFLDD